MFWNDPCEWFIFSIVWENNGKIYYKRGDWRNEYLEIRSELEKYPSWIKNIIAFIDCDTELGMDGLDLKSYADAVKVFDEIGLIEEAEVLRDYDNDISEENADKCYERLAINNDYDAFFDKVYVYADKNISDITGYL